MATLKYLRSAPFFLIHIAALGILFFPVTWKWVALCLASYVMGVLGVTAGYHRYFSHRTYKLSRISQFFLAVFAQASTTQKGVLWWASHHRTHHRSADQPEDIHSTLQQGFLWAHVGWILSDSYRETDWDQIQDFAKYPELRFINKYYLLPPITYGVLLFLIGGLPAFFWGFALSTIFCWHATFAINSLTHTFGSRRYATEDDSRNNFWLGFIFLGEGWHNNHHAYQSSARQGFFWWEIDVTYYVLKAMSFLGIVTDIRSPPLQHLESRRLHLQYAERFATILSTEEETRKTLSHPALAQYIYLSYFADQVTPGELRVALHDLVYSPEIAQHDLYELLNQKLKISLTDPAIRTKVSKDLTDADKYLRPKKLRVVFYPLLTKLRQLLSFPSTILRLRKFTSQSFSQGAMDRALFDFYGATQLGLKESLLRPWEETADDFSAVRPGQIENISPSLWVNLAHYAAETEMPIHGYSTASGEAFRALLPSLSMYLGRTIEEEIAYDFANPIENGAERPFEFCVHVWCREETRHEWTIQKVAEHVSGKPKLTRKTYAANPPGDFSDPKYTLRHLTDRNCSEWHANGLYLYLRSHSTGAANRWIDNVRGDETKHMAVFSAAYKYIFGTQLNHRTIEMLRNTLVLKRAGEATNSSGEIFVELRGLPMFELFLSHVFIEKRVRRYLRSIPFKTMEKLFERPVITVPPLKSAPLSKEKAELLQETIIREHNSRAELARWKPKERTKYLGLRNVERLHGTLLSKLIEESFASFKGAEIPGSKIEKNILARIKKLRTTLGRKTDSLIQLSLRETLRDYQIMNNPFVRKKSSLTVRFESAETGFVVEKRKSISVDDPYICFCHSIPLSQIRQAIQNGSTRLEDIQRETLASTGCGECECTVIDLLKNALSETTT